MINIKYLPTAGLKGRWCFSKGNIIKRGASDDEEILTSVCFKKKKKMFSCCFTRQKNSYICQTFLSYATTVSFCINVRRPICIKLQTFSWIFFAKPSSLFDRSYYILLFHFSFLLVWTFGVSAVLRRIKENIFEKKKWTKEKVFT